MSSRGVIPDYHGKTPSAYHFFGKQYDVKNTKIRQNCRVEEESWGKGAQKAARFERLNFLWKTDGSYQIYGR